MSVRMENICDSIKKSLKSLDDNFDMSEMEKLYSDYNKYCLEILSVKNTPREVKDYLLLEETNAILPKEYSVITEMADLKQKVQDYLKKQILLELKSDNFAKISEYLVFGVTGDIKNIVLFDYIEDMFRENGLLKELLEIFRTAFIVTTNPDYFMKIGDIQFLQKDYNAAIDSYLSFAEINGPTMKVYKKLEELFRLINDEDSRLACVEQMKNLEVGNVC